MKKILFSSIMSLSLISGLSAYELNGDLGVQWTGYKTPKKVAVSGTFDDVKISIEKHDDLVAFLKSAKADIKTASFNSKNPGRDKSIIGSLFSLATSANIIGSISQVNEKDKTLVLDFTMNEISKKVPMNYIVENNNIVATGKIDMLDFGMDKPYKAFSEVCGTLHQGVSYSEVGIKFTLPYK